jgi:hypothetical protein
MRASVEATTVETATGPAAAKAASPAAAATKTAAASSSGSWHMNYLLNC